MIFLDLQFSTDDEEFEEVNSDAEGISIAVEQGDVAGPSTQNIQSGLKIEEPNDSQQAAEAMVQLSGINFYTQPKGKKSLTNFLSHNLLTLLFVLLF